MAKPTIVVKFPHPADSGIVHRALNFIEDVYRQTENLNLASVEDIDHYRDGEFTITVTAKRNIGEVMQIVRKQLNQHNLMDLATIKRDDC
jgi:hypothetical protein